jgi:ribonuclease P protein component
VDIFRGLTPRHPLRNLCGLFSVTPHETHLSAQQGPPRPHTRVSRPYGQRERPQDSCPSSRQGPQEADPLIRDLPQPQDSRLGFPASHRILRKIDFETAYRQGRRFGDACFSLTVRRNDRGHARLGLAIGAKIIGNSVARNRLRRIIRESFRHAQYRLPDADIIVGARAAARGAPAERIRQSLESLWQKVTTTCAASSAP